MCFYVPKVFGVLDEIVDVTRSSGMVWSPEKFRGLSVTYRDHREGPGGSTRWGHRPQRAAWAKCGRGPASCGLVHPTQGPKAPRVGNPRGLLPL